jgi:four helix bundle protein
MESKGALTRGKSTNQTQKRRNLTMDRDLITRTKDFALRIIRLYSALPRRGDAIVLGNQVLRSGTSVGAHYREARRAKSDADFISKIEGALQELDETAYWLELIGGAGILPQTRLRRLEDEAAELLAILVTIVTKVKKKPRRSPGS